MTRHGWVVRTAVGAVEVVEVLDDNRPGETVYLRLVSAFRAAKVLAGWKPDKLYASGWVP